MGGVSRIVSVVVTLIYSLHVSLISNTKFSSLSRVLVLLYQRVYLVQEEFQYNLGLNVLNLGLNVLGTWLHILSY
jgi:DNA-binding IclR family transcriptional regulator